MIIKKITTGFVVQVFDTELNKWIKQSFVAGSECDYELENETPIHQGDNAEADRTFFDNEPYLPFDMVEPLN